MGKELTALRSAVDDLSDLAPSPQIEVVEKALRALITRITDARRLLSPLMEPENRDHVAPMKAKQIIDGVVSDLKPLLRSIKIKTDHIDENLRLPPATRAAWSAILQNVIVNAINATIDTSAKRIEISGRLEKGGHKASLRIEDNGAGVDLDDSSDLFEPFERRLEISADRRRLGLGGVGLGLTIVRMVSQSVGCEVRFVDPSAGMSTAFELSWRVENESPQSASSHRRR